MPAGFPSNDPARSLKRACSAALVQIVKLCEDYQNADIEGHDPEAVQADADRRINLICKTAAEALAQVNPVAAERER